MSIPSEAVEGLAKKLFQAATDEPWDAASPDQDKHYRSEAAAALAANEFFDRYAAHAGLTREQVLERRVVATCECGEDICEGFQCVPEGVLLPWRNETVLVRKETL